MRRALTSLGPILATVRVIPDPLIQALGSWGVSRIVIAFPAKSFLNKGLQIVFVIASEF